jgi:hypothetical protein
MKRQELQSIIDEIEQQSGVYILEVENNSFNYIKFVYGGYLFYIQSSTYYPFTDENHPGKWVYDVCKITGINEKAQLTYYEAYTGFDSLAFPNPNAKHLTSGQKINVLLNNAEYICKQVIATKGSAREKELVRNGAFMAKGSTWNDEHKVIEILSTKSDPDGYFPGFQIDIVTRSICG